MGAARSAEAPVRSVSTMEYVQLGQPMRPAQGLYWTPRTTPRRRRAEPDSSLASPLEVKTIVMPLERPLCTR